MIKSGDIEDLLVKFRILRILFEEVWKFLERTDQRIFIRDYFMVLE